MQIRGTTRILGILGRPLAHSFSPALHNAAIRSLGLDLAYLPFPVEKKEDLAPLLSGLKSVGFLGVNVSMPYKADVIPLLDEVSELSRKLGAVNTVVHRNGRLLGDTTDPEGFLRGFSEAGHSFDGKAVLVLGSGASARTIAFTLSLKTRATRVAVAARDASRSAALAEEIAEKTGGNLATLALGALQGSGSGGAASFDVIVNTTPLGMHPQEGETPLRADWIRPGQIVYDIIYNPTETRLMREARERGATAVGGLGMLVHQGIASFRQWTGHSPDPTACHAGIRAQQEAMARGEPPGEGKTP
jgi:shikimate dehydrogenase